MKRLSPDRISSFDKLLRNPLFEDFVEWLDESLEEDREALEDLDGNVLTKAQGSCKCLHQILESLREVPAAVEKLGDQTAESRRGMV